MKTLAMAAAVMVAATAPAAAYTEAFPVSNLYLRTGPDVGYPPVIVIPAGAPVTVFGCVGGWHWCDVAYGPYRGWAAGAWLRATWQQQAVPFYYAAPRYGVPVVSFQFGPYWDRHYYGRPWYRHRHYWSRRHHRHRHR